MDLRAIHSQEATSSSSASTTQANQDGIQDTTPELKSIRSSARVKAAKQKAQQSTEGRDRDSANPDQETPSPVAPAESISTRSVRTSPVKTTRSREGKGKAKEVPQDSPRNSKRYEHSYYHQS